MTRAIHIPASRSVMPMLAWTVLLAVKNTDFTATPEAGGWMAMLIRGLVGAASIPAFHVAVAGMSRRR